MNRFREPVLPSFPQSSSGNPLPAVLLDARLETAGMTGLEQSVHRQEPPSFGGVSKPALSPAEGACARENRQSLRWAFLLPRFQPPGRHAERPFMDSPSAGVFTG